MLNGWATRIPARPIGRNMEVVARAYDALNAADLEGLKRLLDERASWYTPGHSPVAGSYRGRDAVCGHFRRYGGETGGTFTANLLNLLESGDGRVVSVHHNSAERPGRRLDVLCCIVFELADGRIIVGREHFHDLYAWDVFWA